MGIQSSTKTNGLLWDTSASLPLLYHFMMVGAEIGQTENGLSLNDQSLYRNIVNVISVNWGLSNLLTKDGADRVIDVINIHDEHGGRDFLKQDMANYSPNILALCNIPEDVVDIKNIMNGDKGYKNLDALKTISKAFTKSVDHNDKGRWKSQIEAANASIIFIYGEDSFDSTLLEDSDYIEVPYNLAQNSLAKTIFIHKNFLEAGHDYFFEKNLPLYSLAEGVVFGESKEKINKKNFQLMV